MSADLKRHFVLPDGRTACGRVAIRYDSEGGRVSSLGATSDPEKITCLRCWFSPLLNEALGMADDRQAL